jgi:hypothetical protein
VNNKEILKKITLDRDLPYQILKYSVHLFCDISTGVDTSVTEWVNAKTFPLLINQYRKNILTGKIEVHMNVRIITLHNRKN